MVMKETNGGGDRNGDIFKIKKIMYKKKNTNDIATSATASSLGSIGTREENICSRSHLTAFLVALVGMRCTEKNVGTTDLDWNQ